MLVWFFDIPVNARATHDVVDKEQYHRTEYIGAIYAHRIAGWYFIRGQTRRYRGDIVAAFASGIYAHPSVMRVRVRLLFSSIYYFVISSLKICTHTCSVIGTVPA